MRFIKPLRGQRAGRPPNGEVDLGREAESVHTYRFVRQSAFFRQITGFSENMARRKRKKQRTRRAGAGQQQQRGGQPSPSTPAPSGQGVPAVEASGTASRDEQTGQQNKRESPTVSDGLELQRALLSLEKLNVRFQGRLVFVGYAGIAVAVAGVIAAFLQSAGTTDQYDAMVTQNENIERQIDQTDETIKFLRMENRAWIDFKAKLVERDHKTDRFPLKIEISATNYGKIPAFIKEHGLATVFTKTVPIDKILSGFGPPKTASGSYIVPPGATMQFMSQVNISGDLVGPLVKGEPDPAGKIVVEGNPKAMVLIKLVYSDSAEGAHHTTRCFIYDRELGDLVEHNEGHDMK
jgi:hypothetical protein